MPSFGNYHWYPPVTGIISPGWEYETNKTPTVGREYAVARLTNGLRRVEIGGGLIHLSQVDHWEAFQIIHRGRWKRFLFMLKTRHFEMTDSLIGLGDGAATEFQLKKRLSYPWGPENETFEIVRFPWHGYPPIKFPGTNGINGAKYFDTEYVTIKVDGVTKTLTTDYTVAREGGTVTFNDPVPNAALVTASCKFAVLCRQSQDYNPITGKSEAANAFTIPSGISVYEPRYDPAQSLEGG